MKYDRLIIVTKNMQQWFCLAKRKGGDAQPRFFRFPNNAAIRGRKNLGGLMTMILISNPLSAALSVNRLTA